jgi:hypothetical protein
LEYKICALTGFLDKQVRISWLDLKSLTKINGETSLFFAFSDESHHT